MSFLYATRTIRLPVRAVGSDLEDAEGQTLATFGDSFKASAIELLVNAGYSEVKQTEDAYDARNNALRRRLLAGRASEYYADGPKVGLRKSEIEA